MQLNNPTFPPQIPSEPSPNLGIVVVIPAYHEPDILTTLESLKSCTLPKCDVEVIVHVNGCETDTKEIVQQNLKTKTVGEEWAAANSSPRLSFHLVTNLNLPEKFAGVGLARKIGLEQGFYRLKKVKHLEGVLVCLDADAVCETNYLVAIEQHFQQFPKAAACNIHFEHPIEGSSYSERIYQAIIAYELHLRYYIDIQRFTGFPKAFQTVGSSMAVRAEHYAKLGGMNKRKAGEDFYFIHKFIVHGHFYTIPFTKVIPSPRISERVPFGTGRAIKEALTGKQKEFTTYHYQSFVELKVFFDDLTQLYHLPSEELPFFLNRLPKAIRTFLQTQPFEKKWMEIQANTTNLVTFSKRFFQWFNAFLLIKYVHFARDNFYPNIPVGEAAEWLAANYFKATFERNDLKKLLIFYRKKDLETAHNQLFINSDSVKKISKFLSYLLRHNPEKIGLQLDRKGWADVQDLLEKINQHKTVLTMEELEKIVLLNDKQRYSFNENRSKIRANQGHSIPIELGYEALVPPPFLFHGTAQHFLDSILEEGLIKKNRHHVHLSKDEATALSVGRRHGKPVVLKIRARAMHLDGYAFFRSENGVWLTDHVPEEYLSVNE